MPLLGELTTEFAPAATCLSSLAQLYETHSIDNQGSSWVYTAMGPLSAQAANCFPSNYGNARTDYFSPGICPSAYPAACSSVNKIGSIEETIVTCCPTSYTCNTEVVYGWESTMGCVGAFPTTTAVITALSDGKSKSTSKATIVPSWVNAYSIQIRFQSTDFASSTSSVSETSTSTNTPGANEPSGGLSTGAAAGIGVACGVAGIALLAGIWLLYRKRRRDGGSNSHLLSPAKSTASELYMSSPKPDQYQQKPPTYWAELPQGTERPVELQTPVPLAELDSGEHHLPREMRS